MSVGENFGETLNRARRRWALTQADLATAIGLARGSVAHWEQGRRLPSPQQVLQIASVLNLSVTETNELLLMAGYRALGDAEPAKETGLVLGWADLKASAEMDVGPHVVTKNIDAAKEMQAQINDLQDSVVSLRSSIESLPESIIDGVNKEQTDEQSLSLVEETQNILRTLKDLQSTSREIYAPVSLPTPEQMKVPLVPSTYVERIEEYRNEQNVWFSLAGVFLGAILGLTINWVTGGKMEGPALVVLGILVLMLLVTGLSALKFKKRADKLRDLLLKR